MAEQVRLTHKFIDELKPTGKRVAFRDTEVRGLNLSMTAAGTKTFSWVGRSEGKATRITIGQYPEVGVERARRMAKRCLADVADGKPASKPNAKVSAIVKLQTVFDWWYANHGLRLSAAKLIKRQFELSFEGWEDADLSAITTAEVQELHTEIGDSRGEAAANKAIKLLNQLYICAQTKMGWKGVNPTDGATRFREHERERFLKPEEMEEFFKAVSECRSRTARDMIMLCLWTGARRGNVAAMEWSEISGDVWEIPAAKAKRRKSIVIALIPQAQEILNARRRDGQFVFPSYAKSGHYEWPKESWKGIRNRAGMPDLWMHDLRRTLGSWQAAQGTSLNIIGKSLGHTSLKSTQIYARLQLDPVRDAVERAASAIEAASKKSEK